MMISDTWPTNQYHLDLLPESDDENDSMPELAMRDESSSDEDTDVESTDGNFKNLCSDETANTVRSSDDSVTTYAVNRGDNLPIEEGYYDILATNLREERMSNELSVGRTSDIKERHTETLSDNLEVGRTVNINAMISTAKMKTSKKNKRRKRKKKTKKRNKSKSTTKETYYNDDAIASIAELNLLFISKADIIEELNESNGNIENAVTKLMILSRMREQHEDEKLSAKMTGTEDKNKDKEESRKTLFSYGTCR